MAIIRKDLTYESQFTQVPNHVARDKNLSLKARGLLVELLSHRAGWRATVESFQGAKDRRTAVQSAVDELVEHGYLTVTQNRNDDGSFGETDYELCDEPFSGFPFSENQHLRILDTKKTNTKEDYTRRVEKPRRLPTPFPDGFSPTSEHLKKAAALGVDPGPLVEQMRRWAFANDVKRKNWNMVFNQFLANAKPSTTGSVGARAELEKAIRDQNTNAIERLTGVRCRVPNQEDGESFPDYGRRKDEFKRAWIAENREKLFANLPA